METTHIDFGDVSIFSPTDVAYVKQDARLQEFFKYSPELSSFQQVIADKAKDDTDRSLLVKVLQEQYRGLTTDCKKVLEQVEKLRDPSTFTITTAHQPVLFTGPLYVIYKIISAIKLCRMLGEAYPAHHFVPIFVTGGEDHDFEEMNHLRLYNKQIVWETDEQGPVGRMKTQSLGTVLAQMKEILGTSDTAQEVFELIQQTHTRHERYGRAYVDLINGLFADLGLVVLNMDHPDLKRKMIPIFKSELVERHSKELVTQTQQRLAAEGLKEQAYARDINLFYLTNGSRERLEWADGQYHVLNTDLYFSEAEMLQELEESPENFSPNVVTRPLFQETILPNLAYIGGGGELAYWLERKTQFEHFGINYPMLVRRDSCLWLDRGVLKKMNKLGLSLEDFLLPETETIKKYVSREAESEISLGPEKGQLMQVFRKIEEKAIQVDPTLKGTIGAEGKNVLKVVQHLEAKIRRAEKLKHEVAIGQIRAVRQKLFPDGGLQERKDNFLNFYLRDPDAYFDQLLQSFNPLDGQLKVIKDIPQ